MSNDKRSNEVMKKRKAGFTQRRKERREKRQEDRGKKKEFQPRIKAFSSLCVRNRHRDEGISSLTVPI